MTHLVLFLEELSAMELMKGVLPRILPESVFVKYIVFQGKQDLEKQVGIKLRAWQKPDTRFVVLRDKDSGDCLQVKEKLVAICKNAGKPDALVRIACHELESWYLADLLAVERGLGIEGLAVLQDKWKFKNPDGLADPVQEMKRLTKNMYQKVDGSRKIGPYLLLDNKRSTSFYNFITGVRRLVAEAAA